MIHVEGLNKRYGERVLFDDVSWHVKKRDRIGLSGPNGSGKTTLLRMLAGLQEPDSGTIRMASDTTIGYLPQDGIVHHGRTVYEEVVLAFQELLALKEEQHRIEDALAHATEDGEGHDKLLERYAEVTERFKHLGGWEIDARVADVLKGLGFSLADQQRRTEEFSGGWQMRIALAKLLLARPNLLLMDEPTNHLDLPARNWLEEYLADYPGSVVLVSHDRYFLDATVKRITEVGLKTLTDYHGNYSHYVTEHAARMERLREAHRRQSEEIEKAEVFINRFRYTATKARQVQSRIKQLDKVERIEIPPERKKIRFKFPEAPRPGRVVLELKGVRKAYGPNVVLGHLDLMIERGDRIALVGPNGAGKSTLMRILAGDRPPDEGVRLVGHKVVLDYFAQDQAAVLNPSRTVLEEMSSASSVSMGPMIRTILGGFLFGSDDVFKKVAVLSGGERNRLALAKMLLNAVERPPARRAHEPPRPRLQGGPARRPRGLRRDARLRLPRPLLRGQARHARSSRWAAARPRSTPAGTRTSCTGRSSARRESRPGCPSRFPGGARTWTMGPPRSRRRRSPGKALPKAASGPDALPAAKAHAPKPVSPKPGKARPERPPAARTAFEPPRPTLAPVRRPARAPGARARAEEDEGPPRRAREAGHARRSRPSRQLEARMAEPGFYDDRDRAAQSAEEHQKLMWEAGDLMAQWEALQAEVDEKSQQLAAAIPAPRR